MSDARPGLIAAAIVFALFGGLALSVDFPRAAHGFQSDEATYYLIGQSLAHDKDLTYRREDLVRVWRDFPGGPSGVFLKRGRTVDGLGATRRPPFVGLAGSPDPDSTRLFYGKAFIYPALAAPLVRMFGVNGFVLLNAALLAVFVFAGYVFLNARLGPAPAVLLSVGFLAGSVAPAYLVWITPEIFNLTVVFLAYVCWLYKEVASPGSAPRCLGWLLGPVSDVAAALLLGMASFSKPSNALLIVPILAWLAWRRRWRTALVTAVIFGVATGGLFAVNVAASGDWNYQGGDDRRTCYGTFPFQTAEAGLGVCMERGTNRVLTEVIFDEFVLTRLAHNLGYFFVGRYSGLVPYFFPAVFALIAFAAARRQRSAWQYLVLTAAAAEILLLLLWIPYNYFGGGGVLGNRYFMSTYGLFFFLLPAAVPTPIAAVPWMVGAVFTSAITLNPFYASFYPAEHAKRGVLRLLPVELSLVNDLPINTDLTRVRQLFGDETYRFQVYFLDDNAYAPEDNSFWVRGDATAEFLVKSAEPARRIALTLTAAQAGRIVSRAAGQKQAVDLAPAQTRQIVLPLDRGFPYQGTWVWRVSVTSGPGMVPLFSAGAMDQRYLGVRVKPELLR